MSRGTYFLTGGMAALLWSYRRMTSSVISIVGLEVTTPLCGHVEDELEAPFLGQVLDDRDHLGADLLDEVAGE